MPDEPVDLRSFEATFEELESIVRRLEGGALTLDESLAHYEQGVSALKRCYAILDHAEKRLEILIRGSDGELATRPVNLAEMRGEAAPAQGRPAGAGGPQPAPAPMPAAAPERPGVAREAGRPAPAAPPARAMPPISEVPCGPNESIDVLTGEVIPSRPPAAAPIQQPIQQSKRRESGERSLFG